MRTRLHRDLAGILIAALNLQADQCDESADAFWLTAMAAERCRRHFHAEQLYGAARQHRVEAIKLRAFACAAQHHEGRA
jgi:hypothetical protein